MPHTDQMPSEMRDCIQNCLDCHSICVETMNHCLMMGGPHADASHIRILADCAQICTTAADFMLRNSPDHPKACSMCADSCRKCAESCDAMADNDPTMRECADSCKRCAASCLQMAHVGV
jgi:hypothetical protein